MEAQNPGGTRPDGGEQEISSAHWDAFWTGTTYIYESSPTEFAKFCQTKFINGRQSILEIGCGHGRDSNYFREMGNVVYAYDISRAAIDHANEKFRAKGVKFYARDIIGEDWGVRMVDCVYARWLLHALPAHLGEKAIMKMLTWVKKGGLIMLEYKTPETDDTSLFNTEHLRIPVNPEGLIWFAVTSGLKLIYHEEGYGMSVRDDHDPYLARTIFRRK